MNKNKRNFLLVVVLPIVTALCLLYFPRKAVRVLGLSGEVPVSAYAYVTRGMEDTVKYQTDHAQEMAKMVETLSGLKVRYLNSRSLYTIRSGEDARVVVKYGDGSWDLFVFAVSGEVRCNDKNYQAIDNAPLEELMAQIKSWTEPGVMPVSIWGEVQRDLEEPQSFRTRDADQIAEAMALLEKLDLQHIGDDDTVTIVNGEYNAKVALTYADETRYDLMLFGDGRLRYDEKNYTAADAAAVEELMEMIRSWILTG